MHQANMRFTMQVEKAKSYETEKLFEIEEHRLAEIRRQNEIARKRSQDCKLAKFYNTNAFEAQKKRELDDLKYERSLKDVQTSLKSKALEDQEQENLEINFAMLTNSVKRDNHEDLINRRNLDKRNLQKMYETDQNWANQIKEAFDEEQKHLQVRKRETQQLLKESYFDAINMREDGGNLIHKGI